MNGIETQVYNIALLNSLNNPITLDNPLISLMDIAHVIFTLMINPDNPYRHEYVSALVMSNRNRCM